MSVLMACLVLGVSRSGYHAWRGRPASQHAQESQKLIMEMRRIHDESRGTYGLPRLVAQLRHDGNILGKNRVARLMKIAGISGLIRKRFRVKTTDSKHDLPIAPRVFKTEEPETHPVESNRVWASDISYIATDEGFVFLATYLDLFTRKVTGFAMEDHMRTELLLQALDMALGRQSFTAGNLLEHSDRGSQYASEVYREKLKSSGITASMSRKGNCYDNAFAESFFATLKKELIYRNHYKTRAEAKKAIFEYIEVWYNRRRLHSSLGYRSPAQFEEAIAA
jgi:putative transposase